jgi:hypothetical protein
MSVFCAIFVAAKLVERIGFAAKIIDIQGFNHI